MNSRTPYIWGHHRRFNTYSNFLQKKFGRRIQKIAVDAGFSCPNRDETTRKGGCTFCSNEAFRPKFCDADKSIKEQLKTGISHYKKRYKTPQQFMAYFQAYTNTYASVDILEERYRAALEFPEVQAICIGTRPDCMDDAVLNLLEDISKEYFVSVEFGIESVFDDTLEKVNRGHGFEQTVDMINQTAARGLHTGGHIIFGLPGETKEMMLYEAEVLSKLPLDSIKFHQLQILKNTEMETYFREYPEEFVQFSLDEYLDFLLCFLEIFRPDIVIERIASEIPVEFLVNTAWNQVKYEQIVNKLENLFEEKDSWQGKYYP
ncbi:MAG: TIGR01212 family radical SAM protein [Bacteroidetes bacterium]|nr:TIGR01212 family radical SAM protein [Bacteroidota bacterium]